MPPVLPGSRYTLALPVAILSGRRHLGITPTFADLVRCISIFRLARNVDKGTSLCAIFKTGRLVYKILLFCRFQQPDYFIIRSPENFLARLWGKWITIVPSFFSIKIHQLLFSHIHNRDFAIGRLDDLVPIFATWKTLTVSPRADSRFRATDQQS